MGHGVMMARVGGKGMRVLILQSIRSIKLQMFMFVCPHVKTHVNIIGVDVVRVGVSVQQLQSDSGVVVCGVR